MADEPKPEPSPRAFSQATGFVFQVVGFIFALGGCCWWSFAGKIESPLEFIGRQGQPFADIKPAQAWAMIAVCLVFLGGMVLIPMGMGLQHDRVKRGLVPKFVTGFIAAYFWCYAAGAIWKGWTVGAAIMAFIFGAAWTILFLLAGVSADVLKKFPPPKTSASRWTKRDEDDLRKSSSPH